MAATVHGNIVYLIGGVQLYREAGARSAIIILDLDTKSWQECTPKVKCINCYYAHETICLSQFTGVPALLHGHTCHYIGESIFILGGGGNCFSFGTIINSNIFSLTL